MANALTHTPDGTAVDVRLGSGFLAARRPSGAPAPPFRRLLLEIGGPRTGARRPSRHGGIRRFYRADQGAEPQERR